jgi:hypothetical protein
MKLLFAALSALTAACASAAPNASAPAAPAQEQAAPVAPAIYEGTYALQAGNRTLDLHVWVDAQGRLNGELVGMGQPTTFQPTSTAHRFVPSTRDDIALVFTVQDGRATAVTMLGQGGREMSGPRKP